MYISNWWKEDRGHTVSSMGEFRELWLWLISQMALGVNLSGDRQKLPFKILCFCPPQDPFNVSAPEPLELQISHGPEASLYVLFLFEITVEHNSTTFPSNTVYITLYVRECCIAGCFIYDTCFVCEMIFKKEVFWLCSIEKVTWMNESGCVFSQSTDPSS